jgi:hypothetical protein
MPEILSEWDERIEPSQFEVYSQKYKDFFIMTRVMGSSSYACIPMEVLFVIPGRLTTPGTRHGWRSAVTLRMRS